MNKKISSYWALGIIILLTIISSLYILISANKPIEAGFANTINRNALAKKDICQVRVFEGSADIKVWKVVEDGKTFLRINSDDSQELPLQEIKNFQLIDPTTEISEKLESSSEEKPVTIKISGFASLCDGVSLISLNYKEGIFKPYMF